MQGVKAFNNVLVPKDDGGNRQIPHGRQMAQSMDQASFASLNCAVWSLELRPGIDSCGREKTSPICTDPRAPL